jgi:choline monooxygenase
MDDTSLHLNPDIKKAYTLEGKIYSSAELLELSKEKIFEKCWHLICDLDALKSPETLYPFTLSQGFLDEPLLFSRDKNDQIHCMSNVCTHRANILVSGCMKAKDIICSYHGRRFDLSGQFKSMSGFEQACDFPSDSDHLPKVPFKAWNNFLFASLNPGFKFETVFDNIAQRLDFLPHANLKHFENLSRAYLVKANWMLYCENYLEGFHIPFVHQGLSSAIDFKNYDYEIYEYHNLQLGIVKSGEPCFDIPKGHQDYGKAVGAYYYWIFPNLMLNYYPWGLSVNIVQPLEKELTKVIFKTYVWDESKLDKGAGSDLDKVEREDEAIVERVQMGVKSKLYKKGRFSPSMEKGVYHLQQLYSKFMK